MALHEFKLESPTTRNNVFRPREPLYSLLLQMPIASLKFTLEQLYNYDDDSALEDILPETGLTRRETIEHVLYVLDRR